MKVQAQIPSTLSAIHNFIQLHDPKEAKLPEYDTGHQDFTFNAGDGMAQQGAHDNDDDIPDEVKIRCDRIAQAMWESYQKILEERKQNDDDSEDDDDGTRGSEDDDNEYDDDK
jgi:hypothetical protein